MPINGKYTNQEQRQSIVNAANGLPDPNQMSILDRLKASVAGNGAQRLAVDGTPLPEPSGNAPALSPEDAQYQAEAGPDHIAALQAANAAQAAQDPAMAAKLAATQEAIKRFQAKQQAEQLGKLQALPGVAAPKIGQQYPAEE